MNELEVDEEWRDEAKGLLVNSKMGIHLAIFNEPFLSLVLSGTKKVESRFSQKPISPFNKIEKGDVVIIKKSGGNICGIFTAGEVKFYENLDASHFMKLECDYSHLICSSYDPNFWFLRKKAKYATLIRIEKVKELKNYPVGKNDRLGWVVLRKNMSNTFF